jgi:CRISPR-associated protein Csd2
MSESAIQNRYEFVMLYDVENGNPNGDPDAGNMPRIDPETGHGIVTDVCIKRKIRNYVDMVKDGEGGFDIYIKQDNVFLNDKAQKALDDTKNEKDKTKRSNKAREVMCAKYFDIRAFGAVLTAFTKKKSGLWNSSGQVRGPVQLAFGKSIDAIFAQDISITRLAISDEKELKRDNEERSEDGKSNTMGRKHIVPYGLYRQEGFVSANLAQKITGFSDNDLELLWTAIINMFEFDRSAARGKMSLRKLVVFRHESAFGNAPAQKLFDSVSVKRKDGVDVPRSFGDYDVNVNDKEVPDGIEVIEKL